ncbi:MAG: 2-oxoglutarate dehydrogenase, E2 component, dihydrolipoamide succinyltransferase, partial [Nocardioides sp.]|nr:2-oxoglutarate dehydrogenase, E2 component, dihydrolipoamide succinyltransferase [Nocardioides sp.]
MTVSVTMPQLGESVTEGTVTRWLKQEGDHVEADEPLLEVSTDKVDTEIPAPSAGTLLQIKVGEDETVQVGAELATIGDSADGAGEAPAQEAPAQAEEQAGPQDQAQPEPEPQAQEQPQPEARAQSEPRAQEQQAAPQEQQVQEPQAAQHEQPQEATRQQAPPQQPASGNGAGGTKVTMPQLGESVTEGTVTRWLKQEGDRVEADEPLLEVSTDKVDTEIPAPASGTLTQIKVGEDETVQVGAELATIGSVGAPTQEAPQQQAPAQQAPPAQPPTPT